MKNFLEHLAETQKTYEYRIKLANVDPAECKERLENALDAYGLESLSEGKRLPIKESDIDFPNHKNLQIYIVEAVLNYPVNDQQLRAIIAERVGLAANLVVVVPANHPEEQRRWNLEGNDIREYKQGESVLDKPLEEVKNDEASKQYSMAGSLLKELSTPEFKAEGGAAETAKTTNDLPTGDASPVGSRQNKIPSPVKGQ